MDNKSIGNRVFRGTVVIVFVSILAKLSAFLTEATLAAYLGSTNKSDAYYMVSSVKDVIYPMLSVGIWKVFLPLYKANITKEDIKGANELADKTISFFTIVSMIVVLLVIAFAPPIVSVVAPGFIGETRELCVKLVRISAPMYVLIIASAVYASMLQCHRKFLGSQIREVASRIPTIIGSVVFYRFFGLTAMAVALVVGGLVRLLIELPFVDWGYKYKPNFQFKTNDFLTMMKRMPSALVSGGVSQINSLVDKSMASMLPMGTISNLNYGHRLMNVLSGVLSSAVATALYPEMIELITWGKKKELGRLVTKIMSIFCVLMIPVTFACVLFRIELVSTVFQRGAFDENSVTATAGIFAIYCIELLFLACNSVMSNVFYGSGDTRTPMYISLGNLVGNIGFNLLFIRVWGVNGLALSTSLTTMISFVIRLITSRKYIELEWRRLFLSSVKVIIASIFACMIPRFIFWHFTINRYFVLLVSAVIGMCIYIVLVNLLNVEELNDLIGLLTRKIRKRKKRQGK